MTVIRVLDLFTNARGDVIAQNAQTGIGQRSHGIENEKLVFRLAVAELFQDLAQLDGGRRIIGIEISRKQKDIARGSLGESANVKHHRVRQWTSLEISKGYPKQVLLLAGEGIRGIEVFAISQRLTVGLRLEINGNLFLGVLGNKHRHEIRAGSRAEQVNNSGHDASQGEHDGQDGKNLL